MNKKASTSLSTWILVVGTLILTMTALTGFIISDSYTKKISDSRLFNEIYSKQIDITRFVSDYVKLASNISDLNEDNFKARFSKLVSEVKNGNRDILDIQNKVSRGDYNVDISGEEIKLIIPDFKIVMSNSISQKKSVFGWGFMPSSGEEIIQQINIVYDFDIEVIEKI